MKRTLGLLVGLCLCFPSFAQTAKQKSTLQTEITTQLPDNTTGLITPSVMRGVLADMVASWQQYAGVNAQVGTTYNFVNADYGHVVTLSNIASISAVLPTPAGSFLNYNVFISNINSGVVTVTVSGGTINGSANLIIQQNVVYWLVSDGSGTNYLAVQFTGVNSAFSSAGVVPGGRLTTTVSTPVQITGVTGVTSLWYAPYVSGSVPVWDGAALQLKQFTSSNTDTIGLVLALGSNWAANTVFDAYVTISSGSPVLCTVQWTNSTTRATTLQLFLGLQTNSASATCRTSNSTTITMGQNQGTYVGTILTNAANTGQIDYSLGGSGSGGPSGGGRLGIWNMYNRVQASASVLDNGVKYTYAPNTIREARGSANMAVTYVVGLAQENMTLYAFDDIATVAVATAIGTIGFGLDTTVAFSTSPTCVVNATATAVLAAACSLSHTFVPSIGSHFVAMLQTSDTNANTFDNLTSNRLIISINN